MFFALKQKRFSYSHNNARDYSHQLFVSPLVWFKEISRHARKKKIFAEKILCCNQRPKSLVLWGDRFGGFMSLIRKFHLDLTPLWSPTVVSMTWVRYRKCRVTSVVSASRQPLHWTAPCTALIARRSSALGKALDVMDEWRAQSRTRGPIVFLFSHHSANSNLDRLRQTEAGPVNHSPSLESPTACLAAVELVPFKAFINIFVIAGRKT